MGTDSPCSIIILELLNFLFKFFFCFFCWYIMKNYHGILDIKILSCRVDVVQCRHKRQIIYSFSYYEITFRHNGLGSC